MTSNTISSSTYTLPLFHLRGTLFNCEKKYILNENDFFTD